MVFSSIVFLFTFLPITLALYFVIPVRRIRNIVLLIASLVFYAWGEPVYIFLMIFSIVFNYFLGRDIDFNSDNPRAKKRSLILAVVINLLILGFFKYYGFAVESLNAILPFEIPYKPVSLPIGISFYTFQTMSYIIDVYRGRAHVQKDIINFGVYVSMFPQLIAGPIVRYVDIDAQLNNRKESLPMFGNGVMYFIRGLAKKVLIANNIGMLFTTVSGMAFGEFSVVTAWLGALAYTFQIYFDFGGYSDMAIGLGKMFGFNFVKNFDYPYISKSVTEFWRRWHISLGTWFREYVYIPLGGNRVSTGRHIRNILVVWFLTGLWHGASWNFVVWGLYYGLLLLFEKYVLVKVEEKIPSWLRHLYTFILVVIGWVLFASPDLSSAIKYIGVMFGIGASGFCDTAGIYYLLTNVIMLVIAAVGSLPVVHTLFKRFIFKPKRKRIKSAVVIYMILFLMVVAYLVNATYNPFLYFRF